MKQRDYMKCRFCNWKTVRKRKRATRYSVSPQNHILNITIERPTSKWTRKFPNTWLRSVQRAARNPEEPSPPPIKRKCRQRERETHLNGKGKEMTNAQMRLKEAIEELNQAKIALAPEYREHKNGNNSPHFSMLEKNVEEWRYEVKAERESVQP